MLFKIPVTTALAGALACCLLTGGISSGQTRPEFEVASIRPSSDQVNQVNVGVRISGAQVRITAMSLKDYIVTAYRVMPQQVDGPEWLAQVRFDVAGKIPDAGSPEQMPEMLQALLADRFKLTMHRESREFQVYALIVGKGGLKIQESPADRTDAPGAPAAVDVAAGGDGRSVAVDLGGGASFTLANNRLDARKMTMPAFADMLTRFYDRPVVDATGLTGRFDLTLDIAPEEYTPMMIRAAVNGGVPMPPQALRLLDGASGDPLSPALQNAGLMLERRRAPLDVIVVESMLKAPIEN